MNELTQQVIGAAIEVHRELGPGLLESAYEECMVYEMAARGLEFERQKALPVAYKGVRIDAGYRLDFVVGGLVIVELKAVDDIQPIHKAQLLTYLRLAKLPVGLLINFNSRLLKDGIHRFVIDS